MGGYHGFAFDYFHGRTGSSFRALALSALEWERIRGFAVWLSNVTLVSIHNVFTLSVVAPTGD